MSGRDRLLDLLAARATEGVTPDEAREIERLLAEHPDVGEDDLDLAAAAAEVALLQSEGGTAAPEPLPEMLRARIRRDAAAHLPAAGKRAREARARRGWLDARYVGWYAAAAMLVLVLWSPWSPGPVDPVEPAVPTVAEQRADLLASAADVIEVAWVPPEAAGFAGVTGDVVWSNERQAGFLRLRGMPANEPTVEQYQLWIVDPTRDQHPIDGGVFDVQAGLDEVVVAIDAKLTVNQPQVFAITLEQPGGVVVSDGPLLVVAAAAT